MCEIKVSERLIPSQGPEGESSMPKFLYCLLVMLGVPWQHMAFSLCVSLCASVFTWPSKRTISQSLNLGHNLLHCELILTWLYPIAKQGLIHRCQELRLQHIFWIQFNSKHPPHEASF